MAPFHARSKVCIAPIHVQNKFADFALHMDSRNADFAPHIEGSHLDFAPHIERRHSFRDQKIAQMAFSAKKFKEFVQPAYIQKVYMTFVTFENKTILRESSFKCLNSSKKIKEKNIGFSQPQPLFKQSPTLPLVNNLIWKTLNHSKCADISIKTKQKFNKNTCLISRVPCHV